MKRFLTLLVLPLVFGPLSGSGGGASTRSRIPFINVTDLYHPHQDVGDNVDLLTAYALPELELKAVILDCSEPFRQPVAKNAGPGLFEDAQGPRDPGFVPVLQLNYLFNRNVPCGAGPFARMKTPDDTMRDAPGFQQQGVELILRTLRQSDVPMDITSFGSARPVAVAYNRDPALFHAKLRRLHLSAGTSAPGFLEWNVALDTNAVVALLRSTLPIALYPCAAGNAESVGYGIKHPAFSYDRHNTFFKLPDLRFLADMEPPLRRYLEFAITRSARPDFLRALEADGPAPEAARLDKEHYVWETAVWLCLSGRRLVKRVDGSCRIVCPGEVLPTDTVLPNALCPCEVKVEPGGIYTFRKTSAASAFAIYDRGDPRANESALREALPALYRSYRAAARTQGAP
ncbi:MAG: hypothetical protein RBT78_01750 [Kiritimatiellia bacterium]|jgi:hypothetical protein|nr:hypothetical protein [Kiritimatiellia bacterium]